MFFRILMNYERRKIRKYLSNGERLSEVRTIVWRANKYLQQIESDLTLIKQLLEIYESSGSR